MNEKLTELKEKLDNLHTTLNGLVFPVEDFINLGPYTFPFLHKEDLIELPKCQYRSNSDPPCQSKT
ncbi:hypothetical protein ACK83G_004153, partial [Salmonella enterica]